jgi:hypothetical protein
VITLNRNQLGFWSVPNFIEWDSSSGEVILDRAVRPKASERIIFGRGSGVKHPTCAPKEQVSGILPLVGLSSSGSQKIQEIMDNILLANSNVHIFKER